MNLEGGGDEPVKNGLKDGGKNFKKNVMVSSAFCSNGRDSVTDTRTHTHTRTTNLYNSNNREIEYSGLQTEKTHTWRIIFYQVKR